ncbi:MAG: hydroxymethylglutaryl-CoA reductase, degradative [Bacteroidales bacterium]
MIQGFSKLTRDEKVHYIASLMQDFPGTESFLQSFRHPHPAFQQIFDETVENAISNFHIPFAVAPNFLINGKEYVVPMVTEESSVVAAAASAAAFWARNGGFLTRVVSETKTGQIHFLWRGNTGDLLRESQSLEVFLKQQTADLTEKMEKRGGGIRQIQIRSMPEIQQDYHQLLVRFGTADAMGANFINSVLERMAERLNDFFRHKFPQSPEAEIIMAILSNYTPECLVEAEISAPVSQLIPVASGFSPEKFASRFVLAVDIARKDIYRAVTHNKGIMNGIDAVVLATGNDFRAVEAGVHAWASRNGRYESLSEAFIDKGSIFVKLRLPLSLGTTGGLTSLHPLAAFAVRLLGNPSAVELMQIAAATGLASHFSAIRALVTTGIQKGHMQMHLSNILLKLNATPEERKKAEIHFQKHTISFAAVRDFIETIRNSH